MAVYTELVAATKEARGDANSEANENRVDGLANFDCSIPESFREVKAVMGAAASDKDASMGVNVPLMSTQFDMLMRLQSSA